MFLQILPQIAWKCQTCSCNYTVVQYRLTKLWNDIEFNLSCVTVNECNEVNDDGRRPTSTRALSRRSVVRSHGGFHFRDSATVAIPPYIQTLCCGCNELCDWPLGDQSNAYWELKPVATLNSLTFWKYNYFLVSRTRLFSFCIFKIKSSYVK